MKEAIYEENYLYDNNAEKHNSLQQKTQIKHYFQSECSILNT